MAQLRAGRPEAAATVWTWQVSARPAADPSHGRRARIRGLLQAAAGAVVGTALHTFGSQRAALVVWTIAGVIGLCALLSPVGLFAAIERSFAALGRWTGRTLTWLLLPIAFYGFFVPFRALFRWGRRDSMRRCFDADSPSYWSLRKVPTADLRGRQYRP